MHTKTRILHYIAHHPGIRAASVAKHLELKKSTVTTYVNHLYREGKLIRTKSWGWQVSPSISPDDIPDYKPPPVKEKQAWQYLSDAMKGLFNVPK